MFYLVGNSHERKLSFSAVPERLKGKPTRRMVHLWQPGRLHPQSRSSGYRLTSHSSRLADCVDSQGIGQKQNINGTVELPQALSFVYSWLIITCFQLPPSN